LTADSNRLRLLPTEAEQIMVCPPANTEPSDPILTFGRLPDNPFGSSGNLGSAITDPYTANLPGFFSFIAGIIWIFAKIV
jgi:hypothetical protein